MRFTGALRLIAVAGLSAGCGGGGDLLLPGAGEPAAVSLIQGNEQNGRVGEALPQPLIAAVTDGADRPVEGASVVFVLNDPAPGASVDPDTVTTDADGNATASVVLGTRPGAQSGEVRALGGNGTPTATTGFMLTALSETANGIRAVSGEDQSGPAGTLLAQPLVIEVADAFGNPIPGVLVTWSVEGGGSVSEGQTTTGEDGRTAVQRTLGITAGTQGTLASVDSLAGSPVTFVHRATAGTASGVSIVSGDDQIGPVLTELGQDLVVEVRDAQGNPVPDVAVTWVIGAGGGSVTPATSNTDGAGRATAAWTLGATPSPPSNTVSAVVSGIGVVEFSATATAGAPARLAVRTQPSPTAVSGAPLAQQPVIQLLDAQGNEARQSGVEVQVSIASGGGSPGGTTSRPTDGNGHATFTDLSLSGPAGVRTLRFSASGFAPVTSAGINVSAAPTVTTITSDSLDPSRAGDQVSVRFTVTASAGTPTGSVRVRDGGDQCTGSLSGGQGTCSLTLSVAGNRTLTAEYQGGDGFAPSSDTEGHTVDAPPAPVLSIAQAPGSGSVGVPLDPQPVIQLKTGDGDDLAQANVSVSVTIVSGGPALTGQTTVTTDAQGRAAYSGLAIEGDAGQRTLRFAAAGFTSVTAAPIDIAGLPTNTTIASHAPDPSAVGASVTVIFSVSPTGTATGSPTGTVQVSDGVDNCSGELAEGGGSCALALTTAGVRTLTATYQGAGRFAASAGTADHLVQ